MATEFEPHECFIFVESTKIGTHENKAIFTHKCKRQRIQDCGHIIHKSHGTSLQNVNCRSWSYG